MCNAHSRTRTRTFLFDVRERLREIWKILLNDYNNGYVMLSNVMVVAVVIVIEGSYGDGVAEEVEAAQ